jgi:pyridoxamine 5'-phosphate oxidase
LTEAERSEPSHPNACALATADADGQPSVRIVLLRGSDPRGFSFFTNFESHKGRDLAANPRAALVFHWKSLARQVRIEGPVERVEDPVADAYWSTRPRSSQIAARASAQSRTLADRATLDEAVAREAAGLGPGPVPRPAFWGGYRIRHEVVEFWQEGAARLHTRWEVRRGPDGRWVSRWLWP